MIFLLLFWEFFKTGLFSVGGGLATVPFIYDIANRFDWLDVEQIPDMIAIAESTPGPIGINIATYAGYNAAGLPGAVVASFSLVLPSLFVIMIVYCFLEKFRQSIYVKSAFYALRPAVAALIAAVGWQLIKMMVFGGSGFSGGNLLHNTDFAALILFAAAFALLRTIKKHPLCYILGGAVIGIIFGM